MSNDNMSTDNKTELPIHIILSVGEYSKNQDQHNDQNWEAK